jgi:hypothetical protein
MKNSSPGSPENAKTSVRSAPNAPLSSIPLEWMGPWRLPSGMALAEFALQAGFLAPLMLGTGWKRRRPISSIPANGTSLSVRQMGREPRG